MIGIDGKDGTGKSTLATALGKILGLPVINLDEYLLKDQRKYVDAIQYDRLRLTLETLPGCIVEGVCLLAVLAKMKIAPHEHIYIKATRNDRWTDKDELISGPSLELHLESVKDHVRRRARMLAIFENRDEPDLREIAIPPLTEEIIRYHHEWQPHKRASYEFHRIDC